MCRVEKYKGCACDKVVKLTAEQTATNTEYSVPVAAKNNYILALESGQIPPDTTLEEYLNMPVSSAFQLQELGDNV